MRPVRLRIFCPDFYFFLIAFAFVLLIFASPASAQQKYVHPLVSEPVDDRHRIVLRGNVHPMARSQYDAGSAPASLPMERMLLVLKRSPEQQAALSKLLNDQQDKSSPSYHKWLTPEQFGQLFGPADSDIQAVTSWLQSHGLQVPRVTKGRTMIEFSGTAAQVHEALHTSIRKYVVNGEAHLANANDPEIPAALAPVVAGIHSLHNFYLKPLSTFSGERFAITRTAGLPPQLNAGDGSHALVPADYSVIYNINPVYQSGIDGSGTTIAVVGRSNFLVQDVADFQQLFALPFNPPQVIFDGADPGNLGGGEEAEALLDATWSGAVARGAALKFVLSAGTDTTDGVVLSELYIIDNNVGDVMTQSFGGCEAAFNSTEATGFSVLAEEAAAQGITYVVASGDTGAAGCDNLAESIAQGPVSVSLQAATPFTIAAGGTQFNENGHNSTYWNLSNDPITLASVKSYIPENVWNETCTTQCATGAAPLASGGGGVSTFFTKPSWQAGVAGIPNDGHRDVPDISLSAASHDPYILCFEGSCQSGNALGISGTSASAPSFAGVVALVNQQTGSRQGQANYVLYRLAATETLSQCNGSRTTALPGASCIFNDVTEGNNAVPGETGFGTSIEKYQSTVGYDLATGLGSVNVANLVNAWSSVTFRSTTSTLTLTPATFTHGSSANVSITVAPGSGSGTPTGDVSLLTDLSSSQQSEVFYTLTGGAASGTAIGLPGGTYNIRAHYTGDATFAPSDSAAVPITVSAEGSTTTLSVFGFDTGGSLEPLVSQPYGVPAYLRADVAGQSGHGTATGNVVFNDNGPDPPGTYYSTLNSEATATTSQGLFTLPTGQHAMSAQYGGDSGFRPSGSAVVNFTVTKAATTTTVASDMNNVIPGTPVTFTATVNTNSGGQPPGGTLIFLSNGSPLNANNPSSVGGVRSGSGNIQTGAFLTAQSSGQGVFTLAVGQNNITAQYSGDAYYTGSTASATVVNVQPDFSFAASETTLAVSAPGGSGTLTLTVTGQPGYNSTINFTASSCSGLPRESTCSFNPATVAGSGSTTVTVATTAAHSAKLESPGWLGASLSMTLAGVFLLGKGTKRRGFGRFLSFLAFALVITIAGCGGGGSSGGGGGGNRDPGTPVGTSTITVTATAGGISHTATFTLAVQ
jgi:Pro-kumamolisin, activation domain/Bacterial Ig-like domain (group 3)